MASMGGSVCRAQALLSVCFFWRRLTFSITLRADQNVRGAHLRTIGALRRGWRRRFSRRSLPVARHPPPPPPTTQAGPRRVQVRSRRLSCSCAPVRASHSHTQLAIAALPHAHPCTCRPAGLACGWQCLSSPALRASPITYLAHAAAVLGRDSHGFPPASSAARLHSSDWCMSCRKQTAEDRNA